MGVLRFLVFLVGGACVYVGVVPRYSEVNGKPGEVLTWLVVVGVAMIIASLVSWEPGPRGAEDQRKAVHDKWDINKPYIVDKVEAKRLAQKAASLNVIRGLEQEIIKKSAEVENLPELIELAHEQQVTQAGVVISSNKSAARLGVSNVANDEIKKDEHTKNTQLRLEQGQSEIRVKEYEDKKWIDLDISKEEQKIEAMVALIVRNAEQFDIELLTNHLFRAIDLKDKLLLLPESKSRKKKIKRLKKNIRILEEAIDGRGQQLIQGANRHIKGTVEAE